jgi:pyridoxine kinase
MDDYSESQSRDQFICQRFSALRNKKLYTGRLLGVTGSMMTKNPAFSDDLPFQPRILAIQSAVLVGAVGNDAAIPVYTHFRQKAARLDTVRLAAHPGFQAGFSDITLAASLAALLEDFIRLPHIALPEAVQTGYFGAADQIAPVASFLGQCRKQGDSFYLLDPVLGDAGKLYVDPAIAVAMQEKLLPLADLMTPNAFELGWLSGRNIASLADAEQAAGELLANSGQRLRGIFATGIDAGEGRIADMLVTPEGMKTFTHPRKSHGVSGSGDVLSALVISFFLRSKNLEDACQQASQLIRDMIAGTSSPLGLDVARLLAEASPKV